MRAVADIVQPGRGVLLKYGCGPGDDGGVFIIKYRNAEFRVIASWGGNWDHVSVSLPDRSPTWDEMEHVKRCFYLPDEVVMQIHPIWTEYVNCHPYCLHLWRPQNQTIPVPPTWMVGPRKVEK